VEGWRDGEIDRRSDPKQRSPFRSRQTRSALPLIHRSARMLRVLTLALAATSGSYAYQLGAATSVARAGGKHALAAKLPGRVGPTCMAAPAAEIAVPTSHAEGGGDGRPKKIFVLGGDGFCGWPTALHLSDKGHEVVIIDNLSRRKIDVELGCSSLTPIVSPEERVATWNSLDGNHPPIRYEYLDLAREYDRFAPAAQGREAYRRRVLSACI
jgi:hypothetical protein